MACKTGVNRQTTDGPVDGQPTDGQLERRPENITPLASTHDGGIKILTIKLLNISKTGT